MKYFELSSSNLSDELKLYLKEEESKNTEIEKLVLSMIDNIKNNGFKAVAEYSKKFDNFDLNDKNFKVSENEINQLASKIDPLLSRSLEYAVERIRNFHIKQMQEGYSIKDTDNNKMGQKVIPLSSAAIYIPGGQALYPSTLYMTAVPAITAGVKRIALFSSPKTFNESSAAARLVQILGIKEIYRIGGAQAIIAASFGTENIKPVDKIAGPGNQYVATAKKLVYGIVDIDMIAGPSEILVIADTEDQKDIPLIAADLLSQAEHPPGGWARAVVIGTNKDYLNKIKDELYKQALALPVTEHAVSSLDTRGLIIKCKSINDALDISNILAPEHLELFSDNPYPLFEKITNAGSVFLGKNTPESVGDYIGGPNHVLPTSSTARFFSPLGVYDFQKRLSWIEFSKNSLEKNLETITSIARSEGLEAHARSAEIRFKN